MTRFFKFIIIIVFALYLGSNSPISPFNTVALAGSLYQSGSESECPEGHSHAVEGERYAQQEQWLLSIEAYLAALHACEDSHEYLSSLAGTLVERAMVAPRSEYDWKFDPEKFDNITLDEILELSLEEVTEMYDVELLTVAEELLLEAQRLEPGSALYTVDLARLHRTWSELLIDSDQRQEQIALSIGFYDQAIEMSPDDPAIWNEKGNLYLLVGQDSLALDSYEEGLALDPLYAETYSLIANYHFQQADYQAVVDLLKPAIVKLERADQNKDLLLLFNFFGAAQVQLGFYEDALAAFERMETIDPFNIDTITKILILSKDLGKLDYDSLLPRLERAVPFLEQATRGERLAYHRLLAELYENADPRPVDPAKYEKFLDLALSLIDEGQVDQLVQDAGENGTTLAQHAKLRKQALYVKRPY